METGLLAVSLHSGDCAHFEIVSLEFDAKDVHSQGIPYYGTGKWTVKSF